MTPDPSETFASRLREVMKEQNLTQVDIARRAGVTQSAVSLWLQDTKPQKRKVQMLAIRLELSEKWLLYGIGEKECPPDVRQAQEDAKGANKAIVQRLLAETSTVRRRISVMDSQLGKTKEYIFDAATNEQWELIFAQVETSYYTVMRHASRTHPMS